MSPLATLVDPDYTTYPGYETIDEAEANVMQYTFEGNKSSVGTAELLQPSRPGSAFTSSGR